MIKFIEIEEFGTKQKYYINVGLIKTITPVEKDKRGKSCARCKLGLVDAHEKSDVEINEPYEEFLGRLKTFLDHEHGCFCSCPLF